MPHPPVFRARMLGVVVAGGVLGVALRELLLLPFAQPATASSAAGALVIGTMSVNVLGSLALGVVVGMLGDRLPLARGFVGTGLLGGFTTYSAFAVQTATLLGDAPIVGVVLGLTAVCLGVGAAALGVRLTRRRGPSGPVVEPEAVP